MQSLPFDVLQRREQHGKGKAKARRRGSGGAAEEGREVDTRERTTRPPPIAFAAEDRSRTTPPSSPQTPPFNGWETSQTPRGRGGGALGATVSPPPSPRVGVEARKRPPLGPRTQTPPSWPPAAETVPSQLIGGRAGPDANRMRSQGDNGDALGDLDRIPTYFERPSASRSHDSTRSTSRTPRNEKPLAGMPVIEDESPVQASTSPALNESPTTSTGSGSSTSSYASSFAYLLRNRRSDKRLLHKRSQPKQHLEKRPSLLQPETTRATRSPSYYKPRIVEDTRAPAHSEPTPLSPPPPPASPIPTASATPKPSADSSTGLSTSSFPLPYITPSGHGKQHTSPLRLQESPSPRVRAHSPFAPPAPPVVDRAKEPTSRRSNQTSSEKKQVSARRPMRIELPSPFSERPARVEESRIGLSSLAEHRESTTEAFSGAAVPFTPLGIETFSPRITHGDHYFRMFGEDTVCKQPRPDPSAEAQQNHVGDNAAKETPEPRPQLDKKASDHSVVQSRGRERRPILSALRRVPLTDSTLDMLNNLPGSAHPLPYDPNKSFLANSRHTRASNRSDSSGSSYFRVGRRHQSSSDHHLLTPPPTATHWKNAGHATSHARDDSEPLSPTATRPPRLKWAQDMAKRSNDQTTSSEHSLASENSKAMPTASTTATATVMPPPPHSKYKSADGREYQATSLTTPDAPNFLPSEMKRIDTPPLKEASPGRNRLRAFRSFFLDTGDLPKGDDDAVDPSSRPPEMPTRRQNPMSSKTSLQSLVPKISLPRLRHKTSQIPIDRRDSDPLAVTEFSTPSFVQRYGDARRAKETLMRAYVWEETLREDDDSESTPVGHSLELSLPDHLTNSPLCPLNEKHKSGGNATCPIHGRKRTTVNAYPGRGRGAARRDGNKGGRREPTIVFESGKGPGGSVSGLGSGDVLRRTSDGL